MIVAILLSYFTTTPDKVACQQQETAYVATNGVHLYIILPIDQVEKELTNKLPVDERVHYLSFGWGDKEFYTKTPNWSDLTFSTAFTALLQDSPAALHMITYRSKRRHWYPVTLCPEQVNQLNNYIKQFFKTEDGSFIKIHDVPGYSANDHFYEAKGNYSLFYTSNVWVNQALKEINIETSIWSPFDFGVLHHIKN